MLGIGTDMDDDDFFVDISSYPTNLSNIFGINMETSSKTDENSTLKYIPTIPPKQIPPEEEVKSKSDWTISMVKVVTYYKLINNENIYQGKIGIALLKNSENLLKFILYRDKKNILLTMNVNLDTIISVNHDYLQFKDDKHILWSILFETIDDRELFIKEINKKCEICRINQEKPNASVIETVKKPLNTTENKTIAKNDVDGDDYNNNIDKDNDTDNDNGQSKVTKANLLSRMAKMGKKLPKLSSNVSEHSDSSDVDTSPRAIIPKQIIPTHKTNNKKQTIKTMSQEIIPITSYSSAIPSSSTNVVAYNPVQLQEQQYTTHLNSLLTENRLNNTEVRMNISQLDTKIEKILDKIDLLNYNKYNNNNNNNIMVTNAKEKQDCEEELLNIESLNLELRRENRFLRLKIKDLEQNDDKYNKLNDKLKSIEELQLKQKQLYESNINELNDKLIAKDIELQNFRLKLEQIEKTNIEIEKNNQTFKNDLKEKIDLNIIAEGKISELENSLQEINKNTHVQEKHHKEITVELIKSTMNKLFQKLYEKIENYDSDKLFTKPEVLNTVRAIIKQETTTALNQYQMK